MAILAFHLILSGLFLAVVAPSTAADPDPPPVEDPLSPYRVRFGALVERSIGTTSVPVEFNWRRTHVQLAATGSFLTELNNFNVLRGGLLVRMPSDSLMIEFGASYSESWESPSSRQLALTPYRQPGHPDHLEIDFAVGVPLAEGAVTTAPRFFPAVQLVLNGYAGIRYLVYPTGFAGLRPGQVARALLSPTLSDAEIDNLDDARLPAMQVDSGRYGVLVGLGDDLYFKSGLFVSPRVMVAVPLLAPASGTELYVWADMSLAVGIAL